MGKEQKYEEEEEEEQQEEESERLKALAEAKYNDSNLKSALKLAKQAHRLSPNNDGLSAMVTAFKILRAASKCSATPDWYKVLQAEPFCHFSTIKKQYKKLALILHPDKNPHVGSEEAFKLVSEAFRFLSDKIRRKEYDMKLRIRIQDERTRGGEGDESVWGDTFWTVCSTCRLLHQFERKYLGHSLVCPSCGKSFEAVEVGSDEDGGREDGGGGKVFMSERLKTRDEKRMSSVGDIMERSNPKKVKIDDEMMTLAEFQSQVKKKAEKGKMESKNLNDKKEHENKSKKKKKTETSKIPKVKRVSKVERESEEKKGLNKCQSLALQTQRDLEIMAVEDSDFYDFDKDRVERSFKRGQVWAIYDDDDGMPRHYCLIDEVVSTNPFEVNISWLDLQCKTEDHFQFHAPCGKYKVSRKTSVDSLNIFSHRVDCERAAKEAYRIYPKKGSVWALYKDSDSGTAQRSYDIVVFLTTYSEMHGLSMAYLEKVDGFKTIFKRFEIGSHAVMWLEKDDVGLFSHQIPARKLAGDEAPEISKDCWELDPASLPKDLIRIGYVT